MKSICFVILPEDLPVSEFDIFIKNQISKYYIELELEPYKKFETKEYTYKCAKNHGFGSDLDAYAKFLQENEKYVGIENGLLYFVTTWNNQGEWDYYSIESIEKGKLLKENDPYSIVTLDGEWHSARDFYYQPILDFENYVFIHKDNIEPQQKWNNFLQNIYAEYGELNFAVLMVHS